MQHAGAACANEQGFLFPGSQLQSLECRVLINH